MKAIYFFRAYYEVVDDDDVMPSGFCEDTLRKVNVLPTWHRIATGMVVDEYH